MEGNSKLNFFNIILINFVFRDRPLYLYVCADSEARKESKKETKEKEIFLKALM